jgi:hypothetical protein
MAKGNPYMKSMKISAMCKKEVISRLSSEEGQVWVYVAKLLLVFIVIGIIISQCAPVIWNHISLGNTANKIVEDAVIKYRNTRGDMEDVEDLINKRVEDADARLIGDITLIYDASNEPAAISISIRKIKNTLIFESWSYLAPYTEATATAEVDLYED